MKLPVLLITMLLFVALVAFGSVGYIAFSLEPEMSTSEFQDAVIERLERIESKLENRPT